jgi:hypothetical protein
MEFSRRIQHSTNLLFFDRSGPTKEIWYYEQPLPSGRKNYTKTLPMRFEEFETCLAWWKKREENDRAWRVKVTDLDGQRRIVMYLYDLQAKVDTIETLQTEPWPNSTLSFMWEDLCVWASVRKSEALWFFLSSS